MKIKMFCLVYTRAAEFDDPGDLRDKLFPVTKDNSEIKLFGSRYLAEQFAEDMEVETGEKCFIFECYEWQNVATRYNIRY